MYLSCLRVANLFNQQPIYCTVSVNTVDQSWTGTVNSQFERHFLPVAFDFSCKQVHLRCSWIKHVWSSDCSCCFLPCLTAFFVAARSFVIVAVNCEGIPTWCHLFFPYMMLRHPSLCLASCNHLISLVSFSLSAVPRLITLLSPQSFPFITQIRCWALVFAAGGDWQTWSLRKWEKKKKPWAMSGLALRKIQSNPKCPGD